MTTHRKAFEAKLGQISRQWTSDGLPSRQVVESTADELDQWKQKSAVRGLWPDRPLMLTATLDDGIGQGITLIERYATVAGLAVERIGLLQRPDTILEKCHRHQPAILGLTVLQLDSDTDLAAVGFNRPPHTCIIAGGPVFKFDPDMGARCRVDYIAPNVAYFLDYLLKWAPPDQPGPSGGRR